MRALWRLTQKTSAAAIMRALTPTPTPTPSPIVAPADRLELVCVEVGDGVADEVAEMTVDVGCDVAAVVGDEVVDPAVADDHRETSDG